MPNLNIGVHHSTFVIFTYMILLKLFVIFQENEKEKATAMALSSALREIGLRSIATDALGISDDA